MPLNAIGGGKAFLQENAAPQAASPQFDRRTRQLIEAPITPTLLRLAAPNVLVMVVQASAGSSRPISSASSEPTRWPASRWFSRSLMLMQMMSAGAMGGGISSAIARALGAGRRADADALALHALVIAVGFGLAFTIGVLAGGRWLYARWAEQGVARCGADLFQLWSLPARSCCGSSTRSQT